MSNPSSGRLIGSLTTTLAVLAVVVAAAAVCQAMTLGNSSIVDEEGHHMQVELFRRGRWELHRNDSDGYPVNAMLPGYHLVAAVAARALGFETRPALRLFTAALSVALAAVVIAIARRLYPGDWKIIISRTIQVYFLPVLFPFHFLVYTDVMSQLLCLTALLSTISGHPGRAGIVSLAAAFVRQTNGLFALFLFGVGVSTDLSSNGGGSRSIPRMSATIGRWAPLLLGMLPLVGVMVILGRVGLDAPVKHPLRLGIRNLELSLLVAAVVCAPWLLWMLGHLRARDWKLVATCAGAAALIAAIPAEWHDWNDVVTYPYMLRNRVIAAIYGGHWRWMCRWVLASIVLIGMARGRLVSAPFGWLYLLWPLLLLPQWNVDPRYHILPLVCFTLFRAPGPAAVEMISAGWSMGLGAAAFWSIWWFRGLI